MIACELCASCLFFNDKIPDMPDVAGYLKDTYCRKNFEKCARYQIYREFGREHVPSGLFPNEQDLVPDIARDISRRLKQKS